MNPLLLVAAAAVLTLLVGVAVFVLRRRGGDLVLNEPEAMRTADAALPGFSAKAALVGTDRRSAIVVAHGTRVAVLKIRGAKTIAREVHWHDVRAIPGGLRVDTVERGLGTVFVGGVDVLEVRRAGGDDWNVKETH